MTSPSAPSVGHEGKPLLDNANEWSESDDEGVAVTPTDCCHLQNPIAGNRHAESNDDDQASSPNPVVFTKVYKRRWYILLLYSLFTCTYSAVWNCWGPISSAAEAAFGWDNKTIAMLTNLGPIAYMLSGFILPWLLQTKGLRWTLLLSSFVLGISTSLRCITSHPTMATVFIYIGQFLNGLIGPMAMAAIPQVSSVWFPPNQRVTATSISNSFCILGYAISFLTGPALVNDVVCNNNTSHNKTTYGFGSHQEDNQSTWPHIDQTIPNISGMLEDTSNCDGSHIDENVIQKARREIMRYMYIECGWAWLLFVLMLIYFPKKPPLPPGQSAVAGREDFWGGLWGLRRKPGFLLVAFSYGISTGVTAGWAALLNVTLKPFGVHQTEAGWIGFYSISGSCILALLICRFADHFIRHIKALIILLYVLGTASLLVFACITIHLIPFTIDLTTVVVICGFTLTNAPIPLLFELACEMAYPTGEGAANGFLTLLNNLFCLLFLLVLSVPGVGVEWEHWTVMASCLLCIPMIGVVKVGFHRLDLDELEQSLVVEAPNDDDDDGDDNTGDNEGYNDDNNGDAYDNDDYNKAITHHSHTTS